MVSRRLGVAVAVLGGFLVIFLDFFHGPVLIKYFLYVPHTSMLLEEVMDKLL